MYQLINNNPSTIIWLGGIIIGILLFLNPSAERKETVNYIFKIFTVFGVIGTFYLGWQNLNLIRLNQDQNLQVNLLNMKLTENKIENETFASMLSTLASPQLEVRVGGIYALESLARTNISFYWPVLHTLISYVKTHQSITINAPDKQNNIQEDIQAILSFAAEGQYDSPHEHHDSIDLSHTNLNNIDLSGGKLAYANFEGSVLKNIDFNGSNLLNANFRNATLINTVFANANLQQANFTNTKLINVNFLAADLQYSMFGSAIFSNIEQDNVFCLADAKLASANFCTGFDPEKRDIDIVNKCSSGLTCDSFKLSKLFNTTQLPTELKYCNFTINKDPVVSQFQEAIKSGHFESIPNSIPGRVIYKHATT